MTTRRHTCCVEFTQPTASGIVSLTRCGSSSAQSAMLLGVKAGVAAAVSYHSLTGGSHYQNLIVRSQKLGPAYTYYGAGGRSWDHCRKKTGRPFSACHRRGSAFFG